MKMSKSYLLNFILSISIGSVTLGLGAQELPDLTNLRNVEKREPIAFVPFEYIDPSTGDVVAPDYMLTLPSDLANAFGRVNVKARDYYKDLNEIEKFWNNLGYSLRNPEDLEALNAIDQNTAILINQAKGIEDSLKKIDDVIKESTENVVDTAKKFEKRAQSQLEKEFTKLYEKSVASVLPEPEVLDKLRETPSIIQKPNRNLNNFVYKSWNVDKGDDATFKLTSNSSLSVSGDFTQLEGIADTRADVVVMKQLKANIVYMYMRGDALDDGTVKGKTGLEILGQKVDRYSKTKTGKLLQWRISEESSDNKPMEKVIRKGKEFFFSVGPVPMTAEVGFAGRVYLDKGFNLSKNEVSFSAIPGVETNAYGNVSVGAPIAGAGIEQDLVLLNSEFEVAGGVKIVVPKVDPKPRIDAFVRGDNRTKALSGRMKFVAKAKLPVVGEKRYEKILWAHEGLSYEGRLFDLSKSSNEDGYTVRGAPEAADLEELDVDNASKDLFDNTEAYMATGPAQKTLEETSKVLAKQEVLIQDFSSFLQSIGE